MWKYALPLMMVTGCATLPASNDGGTAMLKAQVAQSEAQVRSFVAGLADPAGDDSIAAVAATVDAARIAVAGHAAMGAGRASSSDLAGFLALGVTLAYCRDGLARIQQKLPDRDAAVRFARGEYALLCLAPLSMLSVI
jgi:hypothetical protein